MPLKSNNPFKDSYSRQRTRGQYYPATQQSQWSNSTATSHTWNSGSVSGSRGTVEEMFDWVTPAYKRMSQEGGIVNHDMIQVKNTRSTTTSGPRFEIVVNGITYWGDLSGPHWTQGRLTTVTRPANRPVLSINIQNMIDLASTRALANIGKPAFNGLVSIGELRETLSYLRNPVAGGIKLANTLARLSRKSGLTRGKTRRDAVVSSRDLVKDLSSIHLSVIYGFKPLVKEISDFLENLRPRVTPRPQRQTSRSTEERTMTDTWTVSENTSGIIYTATYNYTEKTTVTVGFLYENKEELCTEEQWGLRPRDVVPAAWAVMSKSFVVDWFTNFGDFISALVPSANTRILTSWTTTKTTKTLTRSVSNYTFSTWQTTRPGSGVDTVTVTSYSRTRGVQPPTLAFKDLDPLKNDISRLTSMISMLTGTLKSAGNPPSVTKQSKPGRILDPNAWY
ncbi:maturation protein [ssRNA phage SRR6960797_4]|uniref:Maturation protein n=1 Tax=ssRNA phage SRR6960797_4 TaxID=2786564 RepID=A0A8S5L4M1_9VIRU|nr:maturation protein [ssRNA phage SRR6960797_4]DAD52625.1 TPA_asm: maturation protein [ssRNA phage SRR6960797_4]